MTALLDFLFGSAPELYVQCHSGEVAGAPSFPFSRSYAIHQVDGTVLGFVLIQTGSIFLAPLWKLLPVGLRPFSALVIGSSGNEMMTLSRKPIGSGLVSITASSGLELGYIELGSTASTINLLDENHENYASHQKQHATPQLFPFRDQKKAVVAGVALVWKGLAHGKFSSDRGFSVYFGNEGWPPGRRCVLLAAGIVICEDFGNVKKI